MQEQVHLSCVAVLSKHADVQSSLTALGQIKPQGHLLPKTSAATLDAAFSLAKMRAHFDPEKLVQYFDNTFKSLDHFANRAGDAVDAMMADIRIFKNEFKDEVDAGKDFIDLFWGSLKDL